MHNWAFIPHGRNCTASSEDGGDLRVQKTFAEGDQEILLCGNEPTLEKSDTIKLEMGIPDGARGKNTSSSKQSLTEKKNIRKI